MARYYPIKCPYCLRTHTNQTVCFNLEKAFVVSEKDAKRYSNRGDTTNAEETVEKFATRDEWDSDEPEAQSTYDSDTGRRTDFPTRGYFTLSELQKEFGKENVEPVWKQVIAIPKLTNDQCSGELLVGVTLTVESDGKIIKKTMRDRYCECGEGAVGHKLPDSSGNIPSYVILLMGSSNSGKTVYLTSLYHTLSQQSEFLIPPVKDARNAIASLWLSVVSDGSADTDIEKMEFDLFSYGILPPTTITMTNEPLTMEATIKFSKTGLVNKALLFLRDMPGEFLTNRDRQGELMKIASQFPMFDGFMIMFDPYTFENSIFPQDDHEKTNLRRREVHLFQQVIMRNVAPTMVGNIVNQPTAAIITKGDLFFDRNYRNTLRTMGVSYALPLLAQSQIYSVDKPYFEEVDSGARDITKKLSKNISSLLGAYFNNAYFSLVSALSRNPIDIFVDRDGRRMVSAPNAISPWHVADPMLRMLIKLNIIPPLDKISVRITAGESQDDRNGRVFNNRNIINEWGAKYCSGGSNTNLV